MVHEPWDGFGSWLYDEKVLAPLTSIVLNGNHLGGRFTYSHRFRLFAHVMVSYFYIIKTIKKILLFWGAWRDVSVPLLRIPVCDGKLKAT